MVKIQRNGDVVTMTMTFEEYRDLTETLTTNGNASHRCAMHTESNLISDIRKANAKAAWEWSNGIGIPPVNDGELKSFELKPFKFLSKEL